MKRLIYFLKPVIVSSFGVLFAISTTLGVASISAKPSRLNVRAFGASGDTRQFTDGEMEASNTIIHSQAATFRPTDAGKSINVEGACLNRGIPSTLEGTISRVVSEHSVVISPTAGLLCEQRPEVLSAVFQVGTNDYLAINKAIAAAAKRGGTVFFPSDRGGYMVLPLTIDSDSCLNVNGDNVSLIGEDEGQTRIWTRGALSLNHGRVHRAHGILIGQDGRPHHSVSISNLWLDGGTDGLSAAMGAAESPWDISHKGILGARDIAISNVTLTNVKITNYRGEELGFFGLHNDYIKVISSVFSDTIASAVSVSSRHFSIQDSVITNVGNACVENGIFQSDIENTIVQNRCSNTGRHGVVLTAVGKGTTSSSSQVITIKNNSFERIGAVNSAGKTPSAILISLQPSATGVLRGVDIEQNTFLDCQNGVTLDAVSGARVLENSFWVDTRPAFTAFNLVGSGGTTAKHHSLTDVFISRNITFRTRLAVSHNYRFIPLSYIGGSNLPAFQYTLNANEVTVGANYWYDPGYPTGYVTNSKGGLETTWRSLPNQAVKFEANICFRCRNYDVRDHIQSLTGSSVILPLDDSVVVDPGPDGTATIATEKILDGQELSVRASGKPITFASDGNIDLDQRRLLLPPGEDAEFKYSAVKRRWTLIKVVGAEESK